MAQATCRFCGTEIDVKSQRGRPRVCCDSPDCRRIYLREAMRRHRAKQLSSREKTCPECKATISVEQLAANQRQKRYCSPECARASHLRRRREREYQPPPIFCAHCAEQIEYKSGKRRFCSRNCQLAHAAETARWSAKGIDPNVIGSAQRCAICDAADRELVIDHDHDCCPRGRACGKCFRGMLCRPCNVALGMLKDSPALLRKAARYIADARKKRTLPAQPDLFT